MKNKTELYINERQIILEKIFEILNIDDSNNTFFLKDLDNDNNKQNLILELELDIRKYFVCGHWAPRILKVNELDFSFEHFRKVLHLVCGRVSSIAFNGEPPCCFL